MKELNQFKRLFWFIDPSRLDIRKDRNLIIHQVLAYGTLADVKRLFKLYGKRTVKQEFQKPKKGLYQPSVLYFIQYLLGVNKINAKEYLKNIYEAPFRNP